ncbi:cytochrome P450 4c21-like [Wyeomyia smithii]|uniref:cytochrome P450 4c21-like n=1 Tax=Wyeomyia smithii TaxID=174621 RepID=UPI0024680280|nr:cytochrome P450 4c21-like [Wyeomyia smithii]
MWILLLGFAVVLSVIQYLSYSRKNDIAATVPRVKPSYPLFGSANLFLGKSSVKKFWNMRNLCNNKEPLFRFWMGSEMILGTSHPDIAQQILTDPVWLDKPFLYDFFDVNYGLFGAKHKLWKSQRKALNPSFNMKILQGFIPIFSDGSKKLVNRLAGFPEGATVNMMDNVGRFALEMVLETTLGLNISAVDEADALVQKIERYFLLSSKRLLNVFHYADKIYHWTSAYRAKHHLRQYLDQIVGKIVNEVAVRYEGTYQQSTEPENEIKRPQIFVDEIYTNKWKQFTDVEILDNVYTILGAGTDTSALTICYACLMLAFYPEWQQKLYDETMQNFPEDEPDFTLNSIKQLEYLEMFLKETLRLYPVAAMVARQSTEGTLVGGHKIPAGSILAVHVYNLQRDPDFWGPNATDFDPERFSAKRSQDRHPFAFVAFSGGSRNCLGSRYAMISMKIIMVYLLKNFRFRTKLQKADMRFQFDALLRLDKGFLMQLEKRKIDA